MTTKTRLHLLILGLFACIYLLPLGIRPLMEPDETRYAEIPREMLASGDWIAPHLNGLYYFEKPPLGYWANALSIMLFGENDFAVRLPSALSIGLSALLIIAMIRRTLHRDEVWAGPIAALIFITSTEVAAIGTFAVLDSMLTGALTLTLVCYFLASEEKRGSGQELLFLVAAGASCGAAFLIKGFLALVVPALTMGAYLAWERRLGDLMRYVLLPLISALAVALPWSFAIHAQAPDFWRYFFWVEHVQRFMGGEKAQHKEPFWYFFAMAPLMFLPWTFMIPAVGAGLAAPDKTPSCRRLIRFSLCWFCLPFLFFSLSSGKLLTYILPCFPPFAILTSIGLIFLRRSGHSKTFLIGAAGAFLVYALLPPALILIQWIGTSIVAPPYATHWQPILGLIGLIAMAGMPFLAWRVKGQENTIILFGLSPVLLLCAAPMLMPDLTLEKKSPGELLLRHRNEITAETMILSDEDPLRAVCWYLKRNDVVLISGPGELSYGIRSDGRKDLILSLEQASSRILTNPGNTVLVARARNYRRWSQELPPPKTIDESGKDGYIFAQY